MEPYSLAPVKPSEEWIAPKISLTSDCEVRDFSYLENNTDYSLAELISIALMNSPKTKESWQEARESSAEYGKSLEKYFPQADINGSISEQKTVNYNSPASFLSGSTQTEFFTIYSASGSLSYTLLDFGQTRDTSRAALLALYYSDWSHNHNIQEIIQTIMNDYYDYLYQKELLVSNKVDVINAKTSMDAAKEKLKTGVGDVGDYIQAKTKWLGTKLTVVNQKQVLHTSYTTLTSAMGVTPDLDLSMQTFPENTEDYAPPSFAKLLDIAKQSRPDYLATLAQVESKQASMMAAEKKHYPTVDGTLDIGKTYSKNGQYGNYEFSGTVSLKYPLFHGFAITNGVKLAESKLKLAKAQLEQLEISIQQELSDYSHDITYSDEALTYSKEFLASAQIDFDIMLEKYRVGTSTIVELINAQASVADANSKYIHAKQSWYSSLANLAYATGSLNTKNEVSNET